MKVCSTCKIEKDESEFNKDSQQRSGLNPRCRSCKKEAARLFRDKPRRNVPKESKVCCKCETEKPVSEFHRNAYMKDGLSSRCIKCRNHSKRSKSKSRDIGRKRAFEMADIYIRNQIKNMTGRKLCSNDISPELIEIKRAALKLKRELKNKIKNDKA